MSTQLELSDAVVSQSSTLPPPDEREDQSLTQIRPPKGWQLINVSELWHNRELVYFLVWRDIKVRYKQTILGIAWAILQPALMMVVFTLFFSRVAGIPAGDLPYPVFVYAGLVPWTFFATAITNAGNSVVGSERIITKVYFPRLAIPYAAVVTAAVDFVAALGLLIGLMVYYRIIPGVGVVLVPVVFGIILLAALGIGTGLAALNVAYRDFRYVIPFLVQVWMFATPTIYMQPTAVPSGLQIFLAFNPMASLIASFRVACLGEPIPWPSLGLSSGFAVFLFLAGCLCFRRMESTFADII
jgi:lipopolysaccharide transport system permease protein